MFRISRLKIAKKIYICYIFCLKIPLHGFTTCNKFLPNVVPLNLWNRIMIAKYFFSRQNTPHNTCSICSATSCLEFREKGPLYNIFSSSRLPMDFPFRYVCWNRRKNITLNIFSPVHPSRFFAVTWLFRKFYESNFTSIEFSKTLPSYKT